MLCLFLARVNWSEKWKKGTALPRTWLLLSRSWKSGKRPLKTRWIYILIYMEFTSLSIYYCSHWCYSIWLMLVGISCDFRFYFVQVYTWFMSYWRFGHYYTLGLCEDVTAPLESAHLVVSLFLSFLISQMDKDLYLHHRDTLRQSLVLHFCTKNLPSCTKTTYMTLQSSSPALTSGVIHGGQSWWGRGWCPGGVLP